MVASIGISLGPLLAGTFSRRTLRAKLTLSKRVWADDFPTVALAELVAFIVVARAVVQDSST
jgi:hypothetical protein